MLEWETLTALQLAELKHRSEKSFLNFTRIWFELIQGERLLTNWHHKYMAATVDDMIHQRLTPRNLVVNVPPGSTKTEFFSIHAPAYFAALTGCGKLAKFRNLNISASNTLVEINSRRTRDIIASPEFQTFWPSAFGTDKAEAWQILGESGRVVGESLSASISGQIVGKRGGFLCPNFSGMIIMDDPDKPEDMFSSIRRERNQRIQKNTIRSRRADKSTAHPTPILAIQQRLHQFDTSWLLLSGGAGIPFGHLKIPALLTEEYIETLPEPHRSNCWGAVKDSTSICNAGQRYWSFWPQNEAIEQLFALWEIDEYTFLSQYMQDPISLSGNIFNPDHFQWYGNEDHQRPPRFDYRFITVDTAQKTKEVNDFSVMMEWGVFEKNLYAIDMLRGKWEAPELQSNFERFVCEKWDDNNDTRNGNLRDVLVEDKSSGTGLIQYANGRMPIGITAVQRNTDKLTRAMDTVPIIKQGKVWLPVGKPWTTEFVSEHAQFTADDSHKHDDIVDNTMDAVSHAFIKGSSLLEALYSRR